MTKFFKIIILAIVFISFYGCNDEGIVSTNDDKNVVDPNPPTFQYVSYKDLDVDVTFYDSSITLKRISGLDNNKMTIQMKLDGFANSELILDADNTENGDRELDPGRNFKTIGLTGRGFISDTSQFAVKEVKFMGDSNKESCRFYTKDGKTIIEIKNARFEDLSTGFRGDLNVNLIWEEK